MSAQQKYRRWWTTAAWCMLVSLSAVYGLYAFAMGFSELAFLAGWAGETKYRATPAAFVVHALGGGVALIVGPIQFSARLRRHRRWHRWLGRVYAAGVALASPSAMLDARAFDVPAASRLVFVVVSVAWLFGTTIAVVHARARRITQHREWMIRSFALSFFFVTGSFWIPVLAGTALPTVVAHPLALTLSGGINLVAAEFWIRRTRSAEWKMEVVPCA